MEREQKKEIKIEDILRPDEGEIHQIYGIIGSGKTYMATADILNDLKRGQVVYANWHINFDGIDEREDKILLVLRILGLPIRFLKVPKAQFHFVDSTDPLFPAKLGSLTDCIVYLDEGHLVFDSYVLTRMPIVERANVLHTRHFDRTIKVISQRATAIHTTVRGNVNRFFKCEKVFKLGKIILFRQTEYQELDANEKPDETKPVSTKMYFGKQYIFNAYNTKYLRGDMPKSQNNLAEVYRLKWTEAIKKFFSFKKTKT
jgi:hypothetical protein